MPTSLLLQSGTVLIHDEKDHVDAIKADLLVEENTITKIEAGIKPSAGTQIVDCQDKIISPGFIDTHHHLWQTLLKGRHADHLLLDYFPTGSFTGDIHSPADFFWGQLGGALECLDVGTTTVLDHAHVNYSPENTKAALAATVSSGIRSIFGYCPTPSVDTWEPFTLKQDILAEWVIELLHELGSKAPFGNGRVELGLAFDAIWLGKEPISDLFAKAKAVGVKIVTTHYVHSPIIPGMKVIETLHSYGLLDNSIVISHATNIGTDEAALVKKTNSHISATPSTELQMLGGEPVPFQDKLGVQSQCSLGIDCHSNNSASIPGEMRLLLQSSRGFYNQVLIDQGKAPARVNKTNEEAFNLGTIFGARGIGMQDKVGSLAIGKLADLVVFDASSPSMVCAAQHDPVAAVVLHSSPSDIDMVIVDGIVRKQGGKLKAVDIKASKNIWTGEEKDLVEWKDISKTLVKKREVLQEKLANIDYDEARRGVIKAFHIDERNIVERL